MAKDFDYVWIFHWKDGTTTSASASIGIPHGRIDDFKDRWLTRLAMDHTEYVDELERLYEERGGLDHIDVVPGSETLIEISAAPGTRT